MRLCKIMINICLFCQQYFAINKNLNCFSNRSQFKLLDQGCSFAKFDFPTKTINFDHANVLN